MRSEARRDYPADVGHNLEKGLRAMVLPEFLFRWYTDHFVGYFIDSDGKQSQAVVSLYTPMDAIRFVSAYAILNDLRAHKKAA